MKQHPFTITDAMRSQATEVLHRHDLLVAARGEAGPLRNMHEHQRNGDFHAAREQLRELAQDANPHLDVRGGTEKIGYAAYVDRDPFLRHKLFELVENVAKSQGREYNPFTAGMQVIL